jgi:hypothetical protein
MISASVTPATVALNGHSASTQESWRVLSQALRAFTAVRYSRPSLGSDSAEARNGGLDGTALDAALAEGKDAVRRLRLTAWQRFGRRRRHTAAAARQTWAR